MKTIALMLIFVCFLWASIEAGDTGEIYEWIDQSGVKHFTNEPPPPGAEILNAVKEIPSEKASGQTNAQKGTEALNKDLQEQGATPTPGAVAGSSDSINADGSPVVADPSVRQRARNFVDRNDAATVGDPGERENIGDPEEEARIGDPSERENIGDPEEEARIGDPSESKNIGDPSEERNFSHEKF